MKAMWRYAHTPRFKTKASSASGFPGYYQYSNEIVVDLLTGAGLLQNVYKEHLLTYTNTKCSATLSCFLQQLTMRYKIEDKQIKHQRRTVHIYQELVSVCVYYDREKN